MSWKLESKLTRKEGGSTREVITEHHICISVVLFYIIKTEQTQTVVGGILGRGKDMSRWL